MGRQRTDFGKEYTSNGKFAKKRAKSRINIAQIIGKIDAICICKLNTTADTYSKDT